MGGSASQSRGRVGSRWERPCAVAPSRHHPGPGALTTSLEPSTLGLKHDRPGLTLARSLVELSFPFLKDGAMASLRDGCDEIARASIFHGVTLVLLSHLQSHNRPFWGPDKLLPRWVGWVGRNGGGRYGGGGQHQKQMPPPWARFPVSCCCSVIVKILPVLAEGTPSSAAPACWCPHSTLWSVWHPLDFGVSISWDKS